ncbi:hypothetical protein WN943_018388 [Citrus x changshan-huyou]
MTMGPASTKVLRLLYFIGAGFICTVAINKWRELEQKSLQKKQYFLIFCGMICDYGKHMQSLYSLTPHLQNTFICLKPWMKKFHLLWILQRDEGSFSDVVWQQIGTK